jgi:hypothetical protein
LIEEILIELNNVYGITLYPFTLLGQHKYEIDYFYYKTSKYIGDYHGRK